VLRLCFLSAEGWLMPNLQFNEVDDGVHVELDADDPRVRIARIDDGGHDHPVCLAPCRQKLDRSFRYVIQGDGIFPTRPFVLPEDRSNVTLKVRAGTHARFWTGVGIAAVGYLALTAVYVAVAPSDGDPDSAPPRPDRPIPRWALPAGLAGLGTMAVGGILVWLSARTEVSSSTGRSFSSTPPKPRRAPALALTPRGLEF
jgi:hypothetical protein